MNKHTPEPWAISETDIPPILYSPLNEEAIAVFDGAEYIAFIQDVSIQEANAKRIVACVNALAGVEDPEAYIRDLKINESLHARAVIVAGDLREDVVTLKKENDTLRGLLGNSALPCVYCGLPANEQGKCERGFPGCQRADDEQLSHLFAIEYDNECMRKEIAQLRADNADLQSKNRELLGMLRDASCPSYDQLKAENEILRDALEQFKEITTQCEPYESGKNQYRRTMEALEKAKGEENEKS